VLTPFSVLYLIIGDINLDYGLGKHYCIYDTQLSIKMGAIWVTDTALPVTNGKFRDFDCQHCIVRTDNH
jgi:hypothetical protein